MSLQEISRRRAERAEQSGRLSTHLTSYSDAQAQSNFLNVIESYKRGEMYEWPSDFVSLFFNALVDGKFHIEQNYLIRKSQHILLMISIVSLLPVNMQGDIWTIFLDITSKSTHNLYIISKLGIVGKLLYCVRDASYFGFKSKIVKLIEKLGSYNISTREVKELFMFFRRERDELEPKDFLTLLKAVQQMTSDDGPDAFFDFSGTDSGIMLPSTHWPYTQGYSISTWVRIENIQDLAIKTSTPHKPHLYSFLSDTSGFVSYFERHGKDVRLCVETISTSGKPDTVKMPYNFEVGKWYMITIVHDYHRITTSVVHLYVNGKLSSSAKLKYPYISSPLQNCSIGFSAQFSTRDQSRNFCGQFGAFYIFGESLTATQVSDIYSLGSSYLLNFLHSPEDGFDGGKFLFDGKLASKIIACYNARDCLKPTCWDNTPLGNIQYFLEKKNGQMKPGTLPVIRSTLQRIIQVVGGVSSVFPLFSQLVPPSDEEDTDDINRKVSVVLIDIISGLLTRSQANQEQMAEDKGILVISYLLENVWKNFITIETALAFKRTILALAPNPGTEESKLIRDTLHNQIYTQIFFNWDIWIHSEASVQRDLLSYLTMQASERDSLVDFRKVVGIQPLLDMLSDHLWFASKPTSNEPIPTEPKDDELTESIFDKKTIEQRQRSTSGAASGIAREHKIGFHDVRELRAYVLFLFKQIITGRKDVPFDEDELKRLLTYFCSIMKDSDQLMDFVPLVVALLTEQSSAVTDNFVALDGIKCVIKMISIHEEVVRVYCLKMLVTILRKVSMKKKSKVTKEFNNGVYLMLEDSLTKHVVSPIIYYALFELLTGHVRHQVAHTPQEEARLTGKEKITYTDAIPMVINILSSPSSLHHENGQNVILLFLRDLRQLLQSEDNVNAFFSVETWQTLLLEFFRMPLALLEKKKHDDTEEKKKKALGNSLPNNWESVFDPLSGKQYFFDSMTRRATWTDPRLPQDTYEGKESEGPIIDVLYEIYTSLFVICIRQLKDGWKYWEETFSYLIRFPEDLYISSVSIRKKYYLRMSEYILSQVETWATDLQFNYRTKESIYRIKENQIFMENILRFIVFVTSDLLGQFEPSYDPSHFTLSTLININDDLLLKRLIDITDFFFLNGIPQEINFLDFTPQKIETLLPDILLQLILLQMDCNQQKGIDSINTKTNDQIRRLFPRKYDEEAEPVNKRRILFFLFAVSKLVLNSFDHIPSTQDIEDLEIASQPVSLFPIVNFFKNFIADRISYLSPMIVSSEGEKLLPQDLYCIQKNTHPVFLVSFLSSPEWESMLEICTLPSFQATRKSTKVLSPTKPKLVPSLNQADLQDKVCRYLVEVENVFTHYADEEKMRAIQKTESKTLDLFTARRLLVSINRQQKDKEGPWTGSYGMSSMKDDSNEIIYWKLDKFEDGLRRRRRLKRNYTGSSHPGATLTSQVNELPSTDSTVDLSIAVSTIKYTNAHHVDQFDPSQIPDIDELSDESGKSVLSVPCDIVRPGYVLSGTLTITSHPAILKFQGDIFKDVSEDKRARIKKFRSWNIEEIAAVYERRYLLANTAIEIFLKDQTTIFFNFSGSDKSFPLWKGNINRAKVIRALNQRFNLLNTLNVFGLNIGASVKAFFKKTQVISMWQNHQLSNFEYLMHLNTLAGRTYNDLSQWPVFPWILSNYTSDKLDLNDPSNFRDLSKPIGALNPERLEIFKNRYDSWDNPEIPRFLYGSHYSNVGSVLFFLVRMEPFTKLFLKLQSGKFDQPGRTFFSIPQAWSNCLRSSSDVKELIPEFFYLPEFLNNTNEYDFGSIGDHKIGDVILPNWAATPEEFIRIHREALESDYVSENLHNWIDLIFGYKQRGREAELADNLFYYLTYEGEAKIEAIDDPMMKKAILDQVANYGQTPMQLFTTPHLKRNPRPIRGKGNAPQWDPSSFRFGLSQYPITSGIPIAYLISSPNQSKVLSISCDATFAIHKWGVKKPSDSSPNLKSTLASLPYTFEIDPLLGTIEALIRRKLPLPFDESIFPCQSTFAVSSDLKLLLSAGHWDCTFKVTLTESNKIIQTKYLEDTVTCIEISKDNSTIVTGSRNGSVFIWNFEKQKVQTHPRHRLVGHDFSVCTLAISSDLGVVISGSLSGVFIHSLYEGKFIRVIQHTSGRQPYLVTLTTNSQFFVYYQDIQEIVLYSINGKLLTSIKVGEHLLSMILSPNENFLVTGGFGKCLTVYFVSSLGIEMVHKTEPADASIRTITLIGKPENGEYAILGLSTGYLMVCVLDFDLWIKKIKGESYESPSMEFVIV